MQKDEACQEFENFIRDAGFPCVGAKSALARDALTVVRAPDITRAGHDLEIHAALEEFARQLDPKSPIVQSFALIFDGPVELDERGFEKALWDRLQCLHNLDVAMKEEWNREVDPDPASAHFSLSLCGESFFVIGLHPHASRPARRFSYPVMVFNSHAQFETLRAQGKYDRMKQIIRTRDAELAGGINPMLDDFGNSSEARQYSGRAVEPNWQPPFEPKLASQ